MKKNNLDFHNSGWKRRVSLVLIFTMLLSMIVWQGLPGPETAEAAITTLKPWSNIYTNTTRPAAAITYDVPASQAGGSRMLVVAVSSVISAASAAQTCTVSYGGQTLVQGASNFTVSSTFHTSMFYLQESGLQAATNNQLTVNLSAQGTQYTAQVDAAVLDGVDQSGSPITSNQSWQTTTSGTAFGPFGTLLTVGTGDLATEAAAVTRTASTTPRTINTWAANWSSAFGPTTQTYSTTQVTNFYTGQNTTAGTTNSQHTLSGSAVGSMSAMSIKMLPMNLQVGNGTNPANANAGRDTINNALDSFSLAASAGGVTVNTLTFTGSATFTTANIAAVKVYRDNGTIGTFDLADVLVPTSYSAITGNATTITFTTPQSITTAVNYLITVDITAAAAAGSLTGTVTGASGSIGTPTYSDSGSATLTLQAVSPGLTINNGTNPANADATTTSLNNALDAFTLQTVNATAGNAAVDTLTVTGSANFTTTNISGVKVYQDNGTVGTFDGADVLIPSTNTAITGNVTTLTFTSPIMVSNTVSNYLVTVDIPEGATLTQTFTGRITAAAGHGLATPTYNDTSSATLTIKLHSTITSCNSCHNYPPADGTRGGATGSVVGDHGKHNYICSTCHTAPATETSADFGHRTGNIQMQSGATGILNGYYDKNGNAIYDVGTDDTFAQSNAGTTASCRNISCHGGNNPTPQWGVGTATCISCHNGSVTAPKASSLSGGAVTQRDAVTTEFGLAWGHKPSGKTPARAAVADADCIVCHLEGNSTTQKTSTYHADGNIDLRDPDGAGETAITNVSGGAFTFTRFATSYAPGSRTSTGQTSNNIDNVLTQKFCLACHDSNGATNTTARSNNGGTGTAFMPFGGYNLGANYTSGTAGNGAASAGGLIDVKTQVGAASQSKHPILGPRSAGYPTPAIMNAPYNNYTRTAGTLANSVVINCFDCHNAPTTATPAGPYTDRTVVAHGSDATKYLRGESAVSVTNPTATTGTTLCRVCHNTPTGVQSHGASSAFNTNGQSPMGTYLSYGCNICHGSSYDTVAVRPIKAQDAHGYPNTASGPVTTKRAFIRGNTAQGYITSWSIGSCTGMGGTICAGTRTQTYTPGGVY